LHAGAIGSNRKIRPFLRREESPSGSMLTGSLSLI
jgi:hypothetical protein